MGADWFSEASYYLRNHVWGAVRLRSGLPRLPRPERTEPERQFYRLVLNTAKALAGSEHELSTAGWVCDVGCRNWAYAEALGSFFPRAALFGVEVDGGRRFVNLFRRADQAEAFASDLRSRGRDCSFHYCDFREFRAPGRLRALPGVFTFFFPFVSAAPCRSWGLPSRFSSYGELVAHALGEAQRLSAPATIVSCHQGEWEAEIAAKVYATAGLKTKTAELGPEKFRGLWPGRYPVFVFTVRP